VGKQIYAGGRAEGVEQQEVNDIATFGACGQEIRSGQTPRSLITQPPVWNDTENEVSGMRLKFLREPPAWNEEYTA
jgi:hypothetical protein